MKIRDKIVLRNYLKEGDFSAIIEEVDSLLMYEQNSYLYYMKARALFNCGKYNESLDCIKKSFSFPDASNELLLLAGRIYFKLDYYAKAKDFYIHSLKYHPDSPETLSAYSFLLYITGSLDQAYAVLDKANNIEAFNINTMTAEAKISLYSAGYKEEAHKMEKILTHISGDIFEKVNAGLILRLNRNSREASRIFKHLHRDNKQNRDLFSALVTLAKVPPCYRVEKSTRSNAVRSFILILLMVFITGSGLMFYYYEGMWPAVIIVGTAALAALCIIIHKSMVLYKKR